MNRQVVLYLTIGCLPSPSAQIHLEHRTKEHLVGCTGRNIAKMHRGKNKFRRTQKRRKVTQVHLKRRVQESLVEFTARSMLWRHRKSDDFSWMQRRGSRCRSICRLFLDLQKRSKSTALRGSGSCANKFGIIWKQTISLLIQDRFTIAFPILWVQKRLRPTSKPCPSSYQLIVSKSIQTPLRSRFVWQYCPETASTRDNCLYLSRGYEQDFSR